MTPNRRYAAYEILLGPARPTAQIWRLAVGLVVAVGVYAFCSQVLFQNLTLFVDFGGANGLSGLADGSTATAMYLLLGSFGFMLVGVSVAVRVVHKRSIVSVLGPMPLLIRQFRQVLALLLLLTLIVVVLPPWGWGAPFEPNMPLGRWLLLLPFSLVAVLVQVTAEEVLFRGYIQQQLAARFRSPLVWMIIPAALFGLGHYLPSSAGSNAALIALWAGTFGILMADLTARAGTLGPAIAVHFVNNVTAILIVSLPDELSGLALYLTPFSMSDSAALLIWLPVDFAMMIVMWLGARLAIRA